MAGLPTWVQWTEALGPPILGLAGCWIANSQHKLAKLKIRHELFERRFQIYQGFKRLTYFSSIKSHPEAEDFQPLFDQIDASTFLFSREMTESLREFAFHGREWARLTKRADSSNNAANRERDWQKADEHSLKFDTLSKSLENEFIKSMAIEF